MRAIFDVLEQTQGINLQAKFHLNVFIVSASGGQKKHNFGQILTLLGLLYRPPFTDEAKFAVLEQTQGLHLQAKFHLNVFILCRFPVAKNHNFGQILTFLGAPVPTTFYR